MITIENYKTLEGYAMHTKDFRIGEVEETETHYLFRVAENAIPYYIRLHRDSVLMDRIKKYHWIELYDGTNTTRYSINTIKIEDIKNKEKFIKTLNSLIIQGKPKAQAVTGNKNFNNPF